MVSQRLTMAALVPGLLCLCMAAALGQARGPSDGFWVAEGYEGQPRRGPAQAKGVVLYLRPGSLEGEMLIFREAAGTLGFRLRPEGTLHGTWTPARDGKLLEPTMRRR